MFISEGVILKFFLELFAYGGGSENDTYVLFQWLDKS
jgi:hypothetical protein